MAMLTTTPHVRDVGTGEALLLLYAFPLNGAMWQAQIDAFCSHYRLIVPDLPGFGASTLAVDSYTLDDVADWLIEILDERDLKQVIVVSISMGAYIAFALQRRYPERLKALILANTFIGPDSPEMRQKREEISRIAEQQGATAVANRILGLLVPPHAPATTIAMLRVIIENNDGKGIAAAERALAARPDVSQTLSSITVPTLIISGTDDRIASPEDVKRMAALIPNCQVVEIAHAGHISNQDEPIAFNHALQSFLERIDVRTKQLT